MRKATVALVFCFLILVAFEVSWDRRTYEKDYEMERLYKQWAQRVTIPKNTALPNFISNYIGNDEFKAIVAQGEPALPFLTNKVNNYLTHQDSAEGIDCYLAWAIVDIKGWARSDYYPLLGRSPVSTEVARRVLARLSIPTNAPATVP
jgi:hypothetical protein